VPEYNSIATTLIVGLILLVGELGVRLGMTISRQADFERRITKIEETENQIFGALRELKEILLEPGRE
jgi:hypothetical protein